jgi:uncharacterized protein (TIGR01244 family)
MSERKSIKVGSVTAGEQPSAVDLATLRHEGFRSVVNVRQVHESSQGLNPSQEGRLALDLGLAFVHLPVSAEALSENDVRAFQAAIANLPAPVYVHCGLGQRAATLALLAAADGDTPAAMLIEQAESGGIAISPAVRDFVDRYLDARQAEELENEVTFARLVR